MSGCSSQTHESESLEHEITSPDSLNTDPIKIYQDQFKNDDKVSISKGTVGNGSLLYGKLMPFSGDNFFYFDTTSYLEGRAFVNQKVRDLCLEAYSFLHDSIPDHRFGIMECSHEKGGKLEPHITHQNGLSVDFMTPNQRGGNPDDSFDYLGLQHYFLDYTNSGCCTKNENICIDFDAMALHILAIHKTAKKYGLKINKVIFKLELKDELFSSKYGKELQSSGIYFAQKLSYIVNTLHDDHYHIDFEEL